MVALHSLLLAVNINSFSALSTSSFISDSSLHCLAFKVFIVVLIKLKFSGIFLMVETLM